MNSGWRGRPRGLSPTDALYSWLREPGSLTARCRRASQTFRVRLLGYGPASRFAEVPRFLAAQARVREVLLECDGVPVIFASTLLPARRGRLGRWLAQLGERSLGSLLFSHPGFRRSGIEFMRLDRRQALFRRAAAFGLAGEVGTSLWARRSWHELGAQRVLVVEVFLPAIAGLRDELSAPRCAGPAARP